MNIKTLIKQKVAKAPIIMEEEFQVTNEIMIQEILESSREIDLGRFKKLTTLEDLLV